jgi:hypothetical protein
MFEWINSVSIVTMITAIVLLDQPFQGAVRCRRTPMNSSTIE